VALPKGARADWLFEHGTEIGVASFQPLLTIRSARTGERTDRWRRLCLAAAGQCDRAFVPMVHEPRDLLEWLGAPLPDARFVAERAARALARTVPSPGPAVLLVGPEGGLAEPELAAATAHGFVPVGLGPHVLRTETAAAIGAALLIAIDD
jgi:16S rRNA (uracil1498-N3)-methyltransferase